MSAGATSKTLNDYASEAFERVIALAQQCASTQQVNNVLSGWLVDVIEYHDLPYIVISEKRLEKLLEEAKEKEREFWMKKVVEKFGEKGRTSLLEADDRKGGYILN